MSSLYCLANELLISYSRFTYLLSEIRLLSTTKQETVPLTRLHLLCLHLMVQGMWLVKFHFLSHRLYIL